MSPLASTGLLRPVTPVRPPRAAIDLDAERFRLLVAGHRASGGTALERSVAVRFAQRIAQHGLLDDEDFRAGLGAVAALVAEARGVGGDPILVAARPSLLAAVNADGFLQAVMALHGAMVRLLSADEERCLASVGVCEALLAGAAGPGEVLAPRHATGPVRGRRLRWQR